MQELELQECDIDEKSMEFIMNAIVDMPQRNTHITKLSLRDNYLNDKLCFQFIKNERRLDQFEALVLSHCDINRTGLKLLCEGLSTNKIIKLPNLASPDLHPWVLCSRDDRLTSGETWKDEGKETHNYYT